MSIIIGNRPGFVMFIAAFLAALGICALFGTSAEGPVMATAGILLIPMDLSWRLRQKERDLFNHKKGGNLFYVPVWVMGVVWMALGVGVGK
jgi:hypothetical protein